MRAFLYGVKKCGRRHVKASVLGVFDPYHREILNDAIVREDVEGE